ncbi:hypothetical protein M513_00934 [Trichuris suis]|uniref:Uncharacterized protein n=1 Tax=Trichuris suis TaxID=68888 RepID=A0A085MLS5_9BILA|nr:hypothetical protein M513_00934 [Trichuris suis]
MVLPCSWPDGMNLATFATSMSLKYTCDIALLALMRVSGRHSGRYKRKTSFCFPFRKFGTIYSQLTYPRPNAVIWSAQKTKHTKQLINFASSRKKRL